MPFKAFLPAAEPLASAAARAFDRFAPEPVRRLTRGGVKLGLPGQFLLVAAPVVGCVMIVVGAWTGQRIDVSARRSAAQAGAIMMQGLLQPYVQDVSADGGPLPADAISRLDRILIGNDLPERFVFLKLWSLDGRLIYSSRKDIPPHEEAEDEVREAATGGLASGFEDLDKTVTGVAPRDNITLLEVYAPLYKTGTSQIVAVGEFYQSAEALKGELARIRLTTAIVVGLASVAMLALLYLIVLRASRTIQQQRAVLRRSYQEATRLARQNYQLRRLAEHAQAEAADANETVLARVGGDLHDGPIQLLSLLMMSLSFREDGAAEIESANGETPLPSRVQLAKTIYSELRSISSGLVLPEMEQMSLQQVLQSAVTRHEQSTGTSVTLQTGALPDKAAVALKTCCYRVVQESLNNAFRHGGGVDQRVEAISRRNRIYLTVSDRGGGFVLPRVQSKARAGAALGLGLRGMKSRVAALKGRLLIRSRPGEGTQVTISLPLKASG